MSTRFKILHAEDQLIARMMMAHYLAKEPDYDVIEASDGLEAWRWLEAGIHPDLCVLDLMMPKLDGMSLLRLIRGDARFAHLHVILCTAVHERDVIRTAAGLGVAYYLVKPYTEQLVRAQIQKVRLARLQSAEDESVVAIGARLGLAPAACAERLAEFARELNHSLEAVEKCLANLDIHTAATHLSGLKRTANGLGLRSLLTELARLERIPATFNQSSLGPPVAVRDPEVFKEWRQEAWRREYCTAVVPGLARLKRLAERWLTVGTAVAFPAPEPSPEPAAAGAAD